MPRRKLSEDAFSYYVGLGQRDRTLAAVAEKYDCTVDYVRHVAAEEKWTERAAEIDRAAAKKLELRLEDDLVQMNERHLQQAKLLQAKAIEYLANAKVDSVKLAIKALETGWRHERLCRGEPTDKHSLELNDVIRREYDRWLSVAEVETRGGNGHSDPPRS